jgi:quercetin dioxygenase-like cupin family protein
MSTTQEHSNIPSTAVKFAPGLWRTNLQRYDLSVPGREMIQSRVDIEPDSPPIRHFHPGEEIIYVLEGSLEYQIDGQPAKVYNAGEALTVPAGVIHAMRNAGTGTELPTYVVEKASCSSPWPSKRPAWQKEGTVTTMTDSAVRPFEVHVPVR